MGLACALSLPAAAQETGADLTERAIEQGSTERQVLTDAGLVDLASWDPTVLYLNGFSAAGLVGLPVVNLEGRAIGEVADILVNARGRIEQVLLAPGEPLAIGLSESGIPWDLVRVGEAGLRTQASPDALRSQAAAGEGERLSDVIGDFVTVDRSLRYGQIEDVAFDRTGQMQAILVRRDLTFGEPGLYAFPYLYPNYGYAPDYSIDRNVYELPYEREAALRVPTFDHDRLQLGVAVPDRN